MRFAVAVAFIAVATCARDADSRPPRPAPGVAPALPPLAIADYPDPPQQHAPWIAPDTALDPAIVSAADTLFDRGLADPRGCEYRAIELDVGEPWTGATKPLATHGWVVPNTTFAIAWNGLVYRARSIGAKIDLAGDVKTALAVPPSSDHGFQVAASGEGASVAIGALAPIQAILLLRAGQPALAEAMWKAAGVAATDAYTALASGWLWSMYERGITAHMRGDVALAIESWRRLPALATGLALPANASDFLNDIAPILADERRRAAHPAAVLDAAGLAALAARPQPERIARLIDGLDQVAARQSGQPGGVALGEVSDRASARQGG